MVAMLDFFKNFNNDSYCFMKGYIYAKNKVNAPNMINDLFFTLVFHVPNLVHPNPKAADKSWNINQSQYPHIWQCQKPIRLPYKT